MSAGERSLAAPYGRYLHMYQDLPIGKSRGSLSGMPLSILSTTRPEAGQFAVDKLVYPQPLPGLPLSTVHSRERDMGLQHRAVVSYGLVGGAPKRRETVQNWHGDGDTS